MADIRDALQAFLGAGYVLDRELGGGAMSRVFLAQETALGRKVIIKVLPPELAGELSVERFRRETRIAGRLQHPNIVPILTAGEVDGVMYYTMPFIAGESLRARLDRDRQLPLEEALRLVRDVADALEYAHREGLVHRDVKPENILASSGRGLLADFGIAKALQHTEGETLTSVGLSVGTPAYMSPEQASGESEIDGRADIYSLACVLYELLTGVPPFVGTSLQAVIAQQVVAPFPSLRHIRPDVSVSIDAVIQHAASKVPAARFQTAAAFAAALNEAAMSTRGVQPQLRLGPNHTDDAMGADARDPFVRSARWRTPFVGREKERGDLLGRIAALGDGHGSLVLIGGEPGVGKTRLAELVLEEGRKENAFCLSGHCPEMDGVLPYGPVVEQLEYVARVISPQAFRAILGDAASEIARIMPDLRNRFADIPPTIELPPEQQRSYLFGKYREFIERACGVSPLVLLFDDLHWADESTLLLIAHVAQYIRELPILAIGTYRDVELDVRRPFAHTLESLTRERKADRITLRRLASEQVASLLEAMGQKDDPPPVGLSQAVYHETEGNPFFVEEVFAHLAEEGRLFDTDGRWRTDLRIDELDVPEGVRLVIGRRLERLSEECCGVLTSAAVIGSRFDLKVLESLDEQPIGLLLDALDEAARARLIEEPRGGREIVYGFTHELIRQTLLGTLSLPRRQKKHAQIAKAMESAWLGDLDHHAPALAYHLYQAGSAADAEKTIRFSIIAGNAALSRAGFTEALQHFERGLSLDSGPEALERGLLLHGRGDALRALTRWAEAIESWMTALPILEKLGDPPTTGRLCAGMAELFAWASRQEDGLAVCDRGLAALGSVMSAERLTLLSLAGLLHVQRRRYDIGMLQLNQALEIGTQLGDPFGIGFALHAQAIAQFGCAKMRDCAELAQKSATLLREAGNRWTLPQALGHLQLAQYYMGHFPESFETGLEVCATAKEVGHVGGWFLDELARLFIDMATTTDFNGFTASAAEAAIRWKPAAPWDIFGHLLHACGQFMTGDWESAESTLSARLTLFPENQWSDLFWGYLFLFQAHLGREDATNMVDERWNSLPHRREASTSGTRLFVCSAIEGLALLGERDRPASLYDAVLDLIGDGVVFQYTRLSECTAGIAATCSRRWKLAEGHFNTALEQAVRMPHHIAAPQTRRWLAWMLLQRNGSGDRDRAQLLLAEAVAGYRALGMMRHVTLCEGMTSAD